MEQHGTLLNVNATTMKLGTAFKIAFGYVIGATLWILFSDSILAWFIQSQEGITRFQTIKGGVFVLVTGLLLYIVLRNEFRIRKATADALQDSEEKFRRLFEQSPDASFILNDNSIIIDCNDATLAIFGMSSRADLLGKQPGELSPEFQPDGRPSIEKANEIIALTLENTTHRFEWLHYRQGFGEFYADVTLTEIEIDHRRVIYATLRDLSEIKRVEAALRKSENNLLAIFNSSIESFILLDREYRIMAYNRIAKERIQAVNGRELRVGVYITEILDPDDGERFVSESRPVLAGETVQVDREYKTSRGPVLWFEFVYTPVRGADGEVTGICFNSQNITERKLSQEAARQARRQLEILLETVPSGILIVDENRIVTFANAAAETILGLERGSLIGRLYTDPGWQIRKLNGTPFPDEERPFSIVRQTLKPIYAVEQLIIHPDGKDRVLSINAAPMFNDQGQFVAMVTSFDDITERHEMEGRMREREGEYRLLFENTPAGIMYYDNQMIMTNCNERLAAMIQTTRERLIGLDLKKLNDPALFPALHSSLDGHEGEYEGYYETTTSNINLWVSLRSAPLYDRHGQIVGGVALLSDISDRKRSELDLNKQLKRLAALRNLDIAISSSMDLESIMNIMLEKVVEHLLVDGAAVLKYERASQSLHYISGWGVKQIPHQDRLIRLSDAYAGRTIFSNRSVHLQQTLTQVDITGIPDMDRDIVYREYIAVPLYAKGQVEGVLELYNRNPQPLNNDWWYFLEMLAGQGAIAIDRAMLYEGLQRSNFELMRAYDATLEGWSRALELRDRETKGHSQRVTDMTLRMARSMGFADEEIANIRRGSLLHDIGKLAVPDAILLKPGPLTEDEWEIMRLHPTHAFEMLSSIPYLQDALDIPYCHHERWDGSGYPRGLSGTSIPLSARIFAVIDVWEALSSNRPYRDAWDEQRVSHYLQENSNVLFDPEVVEKFLDLLTSGNNHHHN